MKISPRSKLLALLVVLAAPLAGQAFAADSGDDGELFTIVTQKAVGEDGRTVAVRARILEAGATWVVCGDAEQPEGAFVTNSTVVVKAGFAYTIPDLGCRFHVEIGEDGRPKLMTAAHSDDGALPIPPPTIEGEYIYIATVVTADDNGHFFRARIGEGNPVDIVNGTLLLVWGIQEEEGGGTARVTVFDQRPAPTTTTVGIGETFEIGNRTLRLEAVKPDSYCTPVASPSSPPAN